MSYSAPERILQRLEWQVIRPLDGILQGDYRSLFYGFGLDLADLSPSQDFGTVQTLKRNLLIDLTTLLARLLTRHGNRVGAMFYVTRVDKISPARGGRPHGLQLTNDLLKQQRHA